MCISIVANFSVESGGNYKVLKIVSNILSILTLGITFGTVYKYVFLGIDVEFAILFIDLFMIGLGSALFIGFHHYAEKNKWSFLLKFQIIASKTSILEAIY